MGELVFAFVQAAGRAEIAGGKPASAVGSVSSVSPSGFLVNNRKLTKIRPIARQENLLSFS